MPAADAAAAGGESSAAPSATFSVDLQAPGPDAADMYRMPEGCPLTLAAESRVTKGLDPRAADMDVLAIMKGGLFGGVLVASLPEDSPKDAARRRSRNECIPSMSTPSVATCLAPVKDATATAKPPHRSLAAALPATPPAAHGGACSRIFSRRDEIPARDVQALIIACLSLAKQRI